MIGFGFVETIISSKYHLKIHVTASTLHLHHKTKPVSAV
jgi:hypothetical protein